MQRTFFGTRYGQTAQRGRMVMASAFVPHCSSCSMASGKRQSERVSAKLHYGVTGHSTDQFYLSSSIRPSNTLYVDCCIDGRRRRRRHTEHKYQPNEPHQSYFINQSTVSICWCSTFRPWHVKLHGILPLPIPLRLFLSLRVHCYALC